MQKNAKETNFPDAEPEDIPALMQQLAQIPGARKNSWVRQNHLTLALVFFAVLFSITFCNSRNIVHSGFNDLVFGSQSLYFMTTILFI